VTQRDIVLPFVEGDKVGEKVTLTVEAYVYRVEAELVNVSGYAGEDPQYLPGMFYTTFTIAKAARP
jgi:hypothetical protein